MSRAGAECVKNDVPETFFKLFFNNSTFYSQFLFENITY